MRISDKNKPHQQVPTVDIPKSLNLSIPQKKIREARKAMEKAAKDLDFMQAAKFRDEIKMLQERI